jgi:hypothetical protein
MGYFFRVLIFLLALAIIGYLSHKEHPKPKTVVDEPISVQVTKQFSHQGVLQKRPDGYLYLKVDDAYIDRLLPLLKSQGFRRPSSFNSSSGQVKAHISVMYKNETRPLGVIKELGETFEFTPLKFVRVKRRSKEYVALEVESPQLEALRKKYGLQEKLLGHKFHITIGQKKIHSKAVKL